MSEEIRAHVREMRTLRPRLIGGLLADADAFAINRGELPSSRYFGRWRNALRLLFASDDYAGIVLYRLRTALDAHHIPIVPWLLHKLCIVGFGIRIGPAVVIREAVYLPHGNVVLDGVVQIGAGCVICPWVTMGVRQGEIVGPVLGDNVFVGTGAKILGAVTIGDGAIIGAGSVVTADVAPNTTVAGVPARVIERSAGDV